MLLFSNISAIYQLLVELRWRPLLFLANSKIRVVDCHQLSPGVTGKRFLAWTEPMKTGFRSQLFSAYFSFGFSSSDVLDGGPNAFRPQKSASQIPQMLHTTCSVGGIRISELCFLRRSCLLISSQWPFCHFRCTGWQTIQRTPSGWPQPNAGPTIGLRRKPIRALALNICGGPSIGAILQMARILVAPSQTCHDLSVDLESAAHVRCQSLPSTPQSVPASPVGKPEQHMRIVLDRSAGNDLAHFRRHFRDFQAGDESCELMCVAFQGRIERSNRPKTNWIGPPLSLRVSLFLQQFRLPKPESVFHLYHTHFAKFAVFEPSGPHGAPSRSRSKLCVRAKESTPFRQPGPLVLSLLPTKDKAALSQITWIPDSRKLSFVIA